MKTMLLAKSIVILAVLLLTVTVHLEAQTCPPAPVGLQAFYAADGNALDSRSRNDGTLQNGATFAAGQVGQAFSFDGVNDFVDIPASPSLNNLTTQATFEAWIKPQTTGGNLFVFAHRHPAVNESFSISVENGGAPARFNLINGSTSP